MFEAKYQPRDGVKLKGRWRMVLEGAPGEIKQVVEGDNVICTNGKDFLASFLQSASAAAATFTCRYVAIGTDSTAESAAQTALGTESARHTGTVSYVSSAIYKVTATFVSGSGTGAIVEYGLLSSSTAGTMLSRDVESVINKGANDVLTVSTTITLS